jgi:formate dehydrogenase accessory protein FdhD
MNERMNERMNAAAPLLQNDGLAASAAWPVTRVAADGATARLEDCLIEETAVALVFNGITHAVMMATPSDLADLARGFALTEGIVERAGEIYDIEVEPVADGVELRLQIAAERFARLKERRRVLVGRTGCGLCGVDSLREAMRPIAPIARVEAYRPDAATVARALAAMPAHQRLHETTGAVHAAAWASRAGEIVLAREDVGRHNALDKVIGAALAAKSDPRAGFVIVTSRASYEMVHKTASFGAGGLVAVSAPTALAARRARAAGMTLIGFARAGRLTYYS